MIVVACCKMNAKETDSLRNHLILEKIGGSQKTPRTSTIFHQKTTEQLRRKKKINAGKNTSAYWMERIFKKVTRGVSSPHYGMDFMFKGKRLSFSLGTGNKEAAATLAAGIYGDLLSLGVDASLAKHRPQKRDKGIAIATIGAWIEAAGKVTSAKKGTFDDYARCLRVIASGILAMRKTSARFSPHKGGGHSKYRATIDSASLDVLTLAGIQKWRLAYLKKATTPIEELSRKTSANSTIRQARSLFSPKIIKFLPHLTLPTPIPFTGVEFFPRQNSRYISKIDPQAILEDAQKDLSKKNPAAFLVLLLALGAGLRRGEIDTLCWHQIDTVKCLIRIESTDVASLKSADSRGEVGIDSHTASILQGYRAKAKEAFVIEGNTKGKIPGRRSYRAEEAFQTLTTWLRAKGVQAQKPLHELRKELGRIITEEHGIYAASRVLRHASPETTARHYSDIKKLPTVNIWHAPSNVVEMPPHTKNNQPRKKKA